MGCTARESNDTTCIKRYYLSETRTVANSSDVYRNFVGVAKEN